jgi:prophage regulatory protein
VSSSTKSHQRSNCDSRLDADDPDIDEARERSKPKPARFIFRAEVLNRVGVSYTALWFWIRDGRFPAPRELGGGHQRAKLAWLESEVDEWMESRPKRLPKGSKPREVA